MLESLTHNLPAKQVCIVNAIWSTNASPRDFISYNSPANSYFRNYLKHCQPALRGGPTSTLLKTHGDIVKIIQLLQGTQIDRMNLRIKLGEGHTGALDDAVLDNSIDLAVRLWAFLLCGRISI